MAVAVNADEYAAPRQNWFFPGVTPDLDGQCVSLVKWFMQDMSKVPNPQAARGDARYVGKTLVSQGHAIEVPYSERRRGDIICYEYGTYGHIAVQLSGSRVFEQNINIGGVSSKVVAGARVYASRIGSETESWRHDAHIYRLKTYTEGSNMPSIINNEQARILLFAIQGKNGLYDPKNALTGALDADIAKYFAGRTLDDVLAELWEDKVSKDYRERYQPSAQQALENQSTVPKVLSKGIYKVQ